jgi:hypothetical protein
VRETAVGARLAADRGSGYRSEIKAGSDQFSLTIAVRFECPAIVPQTLTHSAWEDLGEAIAECQYAAGHPATWARAPGNTWSCGSTWGIIADGSDARDQRVDDRSPAEWGRETGDADTLTAIERATPAARDRDEEAP